MSIILRLLMLLANIPLFVSFYTFCRIYIECTIRLKKVGGLNHCLIRSGSYQVSTLTIEFLTKPLKKDESI